jgi:hypothetical protein
VLGYDIVCVVLTFSTIYIFQLGTPLSINFSTEIQPISKSSEQQKLGKRRETEGNTVQHTTVGFYYILIIFIGKITRAPRCLGTMLNTYKIRDVLYIPQGMYDLNIPNRHKWGMYTLDMLFFWHIYLRYVKSTYIYVFRVYIYWVCVSWVYVS